MPQFTSVFFGLLSALTWGAGDFCGGQASKRSGVYQVVLVAEVVGAALLAALAVILHEALPVPVGWLWGGLAGLAGVFGLLMLYQGLSTGQMGIVAPLTAVVAGAVPIVVGLWSDGLPTVWQMAGFLCALAAVWLLSSGDSGRLQLADLWLPIAAGLGFGFYFVFMDHATVYGVIWPLVWARSLAAVVVIGLLLAWRRPLLPAHGIPALALLCGVLDAGGNLFFALATQAGRLDVAAVLSSLYPASTVALAAFVLHERLNRTQWIGVVAALIAVVLIAL